MGAITEEELKDEASLREVCFSLKAKCLSYGYDFRSKPGSSVVGRENQGCHHTQETSPRCDQYTPGINTGPVK